MAEQQTLSGTESPKKKLPRWAKILIVLAAVGVLLSFVVGIGLTLLATFLGGKRGKELANQGIEKMIERGLEEVGEGETDVDLEEGRLVVKGGPSGETLTVATGAQLPTGFPSDLPVFSPSRVLGTVVMGPMTMVSLETEIDPQAVGQYYERELPSRGWVPTYVTPLGGSHYSGVFLKGDRQMSIAVTKEGGTRTSFVVSYGLAEEPAPDREPSTEEPAREEPEEEAYDEDSPDEDW